MAQGAIKKKVAKAPTSRKSPGLSKRGSRVIAPKKKNLIQQAKIKKKYTGASAGLTEKNLAQRAGHLEMLAGGKKDRKEAKKEGK